MPFLAGVVTPQDYGATGDGVTDDTAAVQAAINAVNAAGGGVLFFPEGSYLVTPSGSPATALSMTGMVGVRLVGASARASRLVKNGAGTLLSMSGAATDTTGVTHTKYCSIQDLGFSGNSNTGLIFRLYYADNLFFRDVYVTSNADVVVDTAEFWDSRFYNLVVESSGSTTADAQTPNMLLRNSAAASGYGFSTDNVNQIHFLGCRWEGFKTGAAWIQQGVSNSNNPNGIFFTDCKMETSALNGGPHLLADSSCKGVYVNHLYCYSGGFTGGYSTAQNVITWSAQDSALNDVFIANGASATVANGVTLNSTVANQNSVARNVTAIYNAAPTGSHMAYGTATGGFIVENCTFNGSPITTLNAVANLVATSSSSSIIGGLVGGDTFKRFQVNANGAQLYGTGAAAADIQTGRVGTNTYGFSKNIVVGALATLGDNGVGEVQLANATTVPTTNPTAGALVYATSGLVTSRIPSGLVQTVGGLVQSQTSTVTVTATSAITALQSFTVPANDIAAGAIYELTGFGVYSDSATPTITFTLLWGGTGGTVLAVTPAITTVAVTNAPFFYECLINFRSTTSAWGVINLSLDTSTATDIASTYIASPTAATTITTTGSNALVLAVTWSSNSASNTISLNGGMVQRTA
jgi:hypothetical protein